MDDLEKLRLDHTRAQIQKRLNQGHQHSYLKDFVYGAMDGIVTTFAVISGVSGAGLEHSIVVVLGLANILADGFSMAVGNFLGTRTEVEQREFARKNELDHIEKIPEGEMEEMRQIYEAKGLRGKELEDVVKALTSNKELWVNTMLQEELGFAPTSPSPIKAALSTFAAFALFGFFPLLPYIALSVVDLGPENAFGISAVITSAAFFFVGAFKSRFVNKSWFKSGLETLTVGAIAAALAYGVGILFRA